MADVISGKVNPSGKLPFSFPKRIEDNGAHSFGEICYPGVEDASKGPRQEYLDDIFVGYRWHDTKRFRPCSPSATALATPKFNHGKPTASAKQIKDGETLTIERYP